MIKTDTKNVQVQGKFVTTLSIMTENYFTLQIGAFTDLRLYFISWKATFYVTEEIYLRIIINNAR